MFSSLIRRISGSWLPRPELSKDGDATSLAPVIGKKRRLSSMDRDDDLPMTKRTRGESTNGSNEDDASERSESPAVSDPVNEPTGVKEVTKGVKEVNLQEENEESEEATAGSDPHETLAADGGALNHEEAAEDSEGKENDVVQPSEVSSSPSVHSEAEKTVNEDNAPSAEEKTQDATPADDVQDSTAAESTTVEDSTADQHIESSAEVVVTKGNKKATTVSAELEEAPVEP